MQGVSVSKTGIMQLLFFRGSYPLLEEFASKPFLANHYPNRSIATLQQSRALNRAFIRSLILRHCAGDMHGFVCWSR